MGSRTDWRALALSMPLAVNSKKKSEVNMQFKVSLKGSINADQLSEEESAADYPLPEWTRMRYNIHFINSNSRWYITQLEVLDVNPPEEPLNTPDPNLTPRPMATPTPAATELPA